MNVGEAFFGGGDEAVELGFVAGFEEGTNLGTGLVAGGEEVATKYEWFGGVGFDLKCLSTLEEPFACGVVVDNYGGASHHVGTTDADEAVDTDFVGEAANGGVAALGFVEHLRPEVVGD